ncbi:MAG TPA: type II toxin-antitoxin system VapC family toxin [Methylomirabilota bacterium]|nr:type II toxin-antitoxin system VapC family toxin [Methylomirabilota bacterium]
MSRPHAASVYLDTSVVSTALISAIPHHNASHRFLAGLVESETTVVFSQILRLEFSQFWFRLPKSSYLDAETVRTFQLRAWDRRSAVREQWMTEGVAQFNALLARFPGFAEAPFDLLTWSLGNDLMARYRLRSHDAVHAATALRSGVLDFASVDGDFRRVPNLRLRLLRDQPT